MRQLSVLASGSFELHRYQFIDTLRGFAAIGVAVFHFNVVGNFQPTIYQTIAWHGWLGVIAFFVISGFVVQMSLERSKDVKTFLSRRFWRIYPPYLASLFVVLSFVAARKLSAGFNDVAVLPHGIREWFVTLTLTTHPVTNVKTINWVYWSLSYEVAFYLVLAATFLALHLRWWLYQAITVLALLPIKLPIFFLDCWSTFAVGVAIAGLNAKLKWQPICLVSLCLLDLFVNRQLAVSFTALLTGTLVWASSQSFGQFINKEQVLSRVGICSYSLYLIHVPVGAVIALRLMDPYPRQGSAHSLAIHLGVDFATLLVCLAAAAVFWLAIERPSMGLHQILSTRPSRHLPSFVLNCVKRQLIRMRVVPNGADDRGNG
jgi:peptidoglycan/LPS O-acetylase OafA/YrhL